MSGDKTTIATLTRDAFVKQYRGMILIRCALPLALSLMMGTVTPLPFALSFGVLHMALYAVFFWAVEVAARDRDPVEALRRMVLRTGLVTFLITLHACWAALHIRAIVPTPFVRTEAALVIIGVLMFTATQSHMSRWGYLAGITPAIGSLVWVALDTGRGPINAHFVAVICLFLLAVVAITWRQQTTDMMLRHTRLELEEKNAALTDMVEEARAANQAKSDFLAMTSHEIRTPLNAVLGLAEALARSSLPKREHEMARGVVDAGALLKRLLDAMLDINRIEAGRASLSLAPVDLRATVETVARIWEPRAAEAGVRLRCDVGGLAPGLAVMADGGKIEQVLINLVSNAVKFSPEGGEVTICVSAEPSGAVLAVKAEVLDQGPGVPVADRTRIFRAFEQAEGGRERGGAGLGLAICAGNMALMGGAMTVGDGPHGGAAFRFAFTAPACDPATVAEAADGDGGLDGERVLRVLAAEDNAGNRHVLKVLLEPLPVALSVVEDGEQALAALAAGTFDVVLMDANMPVLDGLSALRRMREGGDATPVWMLTANVFDEDVARYLAAGADGVVRKPINLDELFAALSAAADRSVAEAEAA